MSRAVPIPGASGAARIAKNERRDSMEAPGSSLPSMLNSILQSSSPHDAVRIGTNGGASSLASRMFTLSSAPTLDDELGQPDAEERPAPVVTDLGLSVDSDPNSADTHTPDPPSKTPNNNALASFYSVQPSEPVSNSGNSAMKSDNSERPPAKSARADTPESARGAAPSSTPSSSAPTIDAAGAGVVSVGGSSGALSPKTAKLLRRIRRREEELEELHLENNLLQNANRKANEERIVREQERRREQQRWKEMDIQWKEKIMKLEKEIEEWKRNNNNASMKAENEDGEEQMHDPVECQRTIGELTELLQLRESQLELINLDRFKLYEEIETWKIGMERLASLQMGGDPAAAAAATAAASVSASVSAKASSLPPSTSAAAGSGMSISLPSSPSEQKEDSLIIEGRQLSTGAMPAPVDSMLVTPFVAPSPAPSASPGPGPSAGVTPLPASSAYPNSTGSSAAGEAVVEEIWENQQRHPFFGWQPTTSMLGRFSFMRFPFSDESGGVSREFEQLALPPGYVWDTQWEIDRAEWIDQNAGEEARSAESVQAAHSHAASQPSSTGKSTLHDKLATLRSSIGLRSKAAPKPTSTGGVGTDAEGWRYSIHFTLFAWHAEQGRLDTVRRRRWVRRRVWVGVEATEAMLQNALAAIRSHNAGTQLTFPMGSGSAEMSEEDGKPSLSALAAAYSSGTSGDSFSMFTSVKPPELSGNTAESANTRALAALLQLGQMQRTPQSAVVPAAPLPSTTAAAAAVAKPVSEAVSDPKQSDSPSITPGSASTAAPAAPGGAGIIAGLTNLVPHRLSFWRRSAAPESAGAAGATSEPSPLIIAEPAASSSGSSASVPAAGSPPACSYCAEPARVALQYVSPSTSTVERLCTCCLPHYNSLSAYITAESSNMVPEQKTTVDHSFCAFCNGDDTYPVRMLHLPPPPSVDASASPVPDDAQELWRFCAEHVPTLLNLVKSYSAPVWPAPDSTNTATLEPKLPSSNLPAASEPPPSSTLIVDSDSSALPHPLVAPDSSVVAP